MPSSWYFRGSWSDSPTAPNRGTFYASPDILAIGVTEINPDKLNQICVATYYNQNQDPTLNIVNTTTNYVYLRGYNTSGASLGRVQFKLYAMPYNAGIPIPSSWIKVLPVAGSWQTVPGSPEICEVTNVPSGPYVCQVPFMWTQSADVRASHYCFIAIAAVVSNGETFPDNNTIYSQNPGYIINNYNCVQRNIGWSGTDPNNSIEVHIQANVTTPTALNPAWLRVRAENCSTGWEISFESQQPDNSPVPQRLVLPRTKINSSNALNSWMVAGIFNANWSSNVDYFIWRNGIPEGSNPPTIYCDLVTISGVGGGNAAISDFENENRVAVFKPSMNSRLTVHGGCVTTLGKA